MLGCLRDLHSGYMGVLGGLTKSRWLVLFFRPAALQPKGSEAWTVLQVVI